MNKEKLLKLSDTLRGIAEGAEWEYTGVHPYNEEWLEARNNEDPLILVCQFERQIRLKPQPPPLDPYAELKAAHAAGKEIQIFCHGKWCDCDPEWLSDSEYRIKPEPQRLPLCADDVKAGDEFLAPSGNRYMPTILTSDTVRLENGTWLYESLLINGYKIRSLNETDWRPCYKLVEQ